MEPGRDKYFCSWNYYLYIYSECGAMRNGGNNGCRGNGTVTPAFNAVGPCRGLPANGSYQRYYQMKFFAIAFRALIVKLNVRIQPVFSPLRLPGDHDRPYKTFIVHRGYQVINALSFSPYIYLRSANAIHLVGLARVNRMTICICYPERHLHRAQRFHLNVDQSV